MKNPLYFLTLASLFAHPVIAQVIVTDSGPTTPTVGTSDTGYTDPTTNRWGWDSSEGFTQTFTLPAGGTLQSIFLGYNGFDDGQTITLDLSVNKVVVASGIVLTGDDFSGSAADDDNNGEFYWMEFDLSLESVIATAGLNSFTMTATTNTGESWAFAPRYTASRSAYAGGDMSLDFSNTTGDIAFAVTVDSTTPGELQVTSTTFDESGNLVIDFIGESNTNYEVMKSLGLTEGSFAPLTSALLVATDGSGAGQATVPATEAAEAAAAAFFRLEERP